MGASTTSNAVAVIPARFASTRFPGKPLANETGKYLVQHVYEQAARAQRVFRVIVATDDQRIVDAVRSFGGDVMLTRADHPNGTSRLAEVAGMLPDTDEIIVNVQGDEPEIDPLHIDLAIDTLLRNNADMSTLAAPFGEREDPADPNIVKVVCDQHHRAMYFSRSAIPCCRSRANDAAARPLKHVGLYVYRRAFLLEYVTWPATPLEQVEQLEQLRVLERGRSITVAVTDAKHHGIDTPEQYQAFVERCTKNE